MTYSSKMLLILTILTFSSVLCDNKTDSIQISDSKFITKCCSNQEIVERKRCVPYNGTLDFSSLPIFTDDLRLTKKRANFEIKLKKFWKLAGSPSFNLKYMPNLHRYLTEDGILYMESPNDYKRWFTFNNTQYCIDFEQIVQPNQTEKVMSISFWIIFPENAPKIQDLRITSTAMMVSSLFLLLVLVAYAMLPTLRNLPGLMLMAYAASQLGAFLSLGILQMLKLADLNSITACLVLSPTAYYFFLASFCWMNVMSFDIWWTFRGYAKARAIHRRGEKFKFGVYCAYAYGVPLAMTAMLVTFLFTDMSQWPGIITPSIPRKGCFLEGGELFLYLYVPMLILILSNWTLFLMTAFNVWRLRRGTAVLDAAENRAHRSHKQRLGVYLKLSVVMGISWVLEVISSFKPELQIWIISDLYNLLVGLFVFIIFICKRKILKMLKKKISHCGIRFNRKSSESSGKHSQRSACSSSTSTSSAYELSTEPVFVCLNPKGPGTWKNTNQ